MTLLAMFVLSVPTENINIRDQIISSGMSECIMWIRIKTILNCAKFWPRGPKVLAGEEGED